MTIKFPCPHCKKMLSVKEHLAGKRAACPACKQPIQIPAVATAPAAADIEELAAAAFSDEPAKKEEKAPQFVEFTCFYCDEKIKINAELEGKQAPCPECRRILKVPKLVKEGPKDWRKVDTRTPLVAQQQPQAPEGAWGSATSTGRVSRQSLESAEALPAAPVGNKQWLLRGGLAAAVLVAGVGSWWGITSWNRGRAESQSIAQVEALLKGETQLPGESAAELERALGEYYLLLDKANQAKIHFTQARSRGGRDDITSGERDFVLADLAVSQVELASARGGTRR
jgi:DNA-directed RNA polymerase subunit M/transcription elongation factor TFIIS